MTGHSTQGATFQAGAVLVNKDEISSEWFLVVASRWKDRGVIRVCEDSESSIDLDRALSRSCAQELAMDQVDRARGRDLGAAARAARPSGS
ncbi:MAG: hypothetical protein ABSG43_14690 [Solirubrobacteraceae bacterium]